MIGIEMPLKNKTQIYYILTNHTTFLICGFFWQKEDPWIQNSFLTLQNWLFHTAVTFRLSNIKVFFQSVRKNSRSIFIFSAYGQWTDCSEKYLFSCFLLLDQILFLNRFNTTVSIEAVHQLNQRGNQVGRDDKPKPKFVFSLCAAFPCVKWKCFSTPLWHF